MSELLQGHMFPDDADGSTSSPGGFRVRTSLPPGRASDSTVTARRSSLNSPDLLMKSDRLGSSLRTSLRSAAEAVIGCSLSWTDSGTPGGRAWWVLGRLGRRTSGTGCGSSGDGWPTPRTLTGGPESAERKQELGRTESGGGDLASAVQASWPTASARDWRSESCSQEFQDERNAQTRGKPLTWEAQRWSTPCCEDKEAAGSAKRGGLTNDVRLAGLPAPARRNTRGSQAESSPHPVVLNPRWVSCLMGFPPDYLDGVEVPSKR